MQTLPIDLKNELDSLLTISAKSLSVLVARLDLIQAPTQITYTAVLALDQILSLEKQLRREYE